MTEEKRICVGVSQCLLGEGVRYNGVHKRDDYIAITLGEFFTFVPVCPEVDITWTDLLYMQVNSPNINAT
jgi:uncharacterized protein YbbK (DUF523 family)